MFWLKNMSRDCAYRFGADRVWASVGLTSIVSWDCVHSIGIDQLIARVRVDIDN